MIILKPLAVLTGATGGLGQTLVAKLLQRGYVVVATGRSRGKLQELERMHNAHSGLIPYELDVVDQEAVQIFSSWVLEKFGRCDLLILNAGTAVYQPFHQLFPEQIRDMLQVNLEAPLLMIRALLPLLLEKNSGHIVLISSLSGQTATPKATVYSAGKAALSRFAEGLRAELHGTGVCVTTIMPGPIDTPFLQRADLTGMYREKVKRFLITPEQAAERVMKAVERKRPIAAFPYTLYFLSKLYTLLPWRLQKVFLPLLNRK